METVVQPGRVLGLSVSVADGARGVVSWVNGWCTADAAAGSEPGPAFVRTIDGRRRLGPRVALPSSDDAVGTIAVALPSGARTVSWVESGATRTGVFSVGIDAADVLGTLTTVEGGLVPHRATGGGVALLWQTPSASGTGPWHVSLWRP